MDCCWVCATTTPGLDARNGEHSHSATPPPKSKSIHIAADRRGTKKTVAGVFRSSPVPGHSMSKTTVKVVVFHCWLAPRVWAHNITSHNNNQQHQPTTNNPTTPRRCVVTAAVVVMMMMCGCVLLSHHNIVSPESSSMALASHLCYTPHVVAQHQTRVKLNRVFFPR